jgi:four helix bundle protein
VSNFKQIEEIEVWQRAMALVKDIYRITRNTEFSKDFILRDQIRRAAISIPSNIAEGFERSGNKEFLNFLSIAKGSAGEVKCQLYIARDQGYIDDAEFLSMKTSITDLGKMIGGLMKYLSQSGMKGNKFNQYQTPSG